MGKSDWSCACEMKCGRIVLNLSEDDMYEIKSLSAYSIATICLVHLREKVGVLTSPSPISIFGKSRIMSHCPKKP